MTAASSRAPRPLADDLTAAPISVARAVDMGVTRSELRSQFWKPSTRGFYLWAGTDPEQVAVRIAQAVALLPQGAAIGGWASLYLQGATDLDGGPDLQIGRVAGLRRSRAGRPEKRPTVPDAPAAVLVSVGPGARIRTRTGIDISRRCLPDDDVLMVDDVPCVRAARAVVDLMSHQPAEEGLVSLDAYLRAGLGTVEDVLAYIGEHPRLPGRVRISRLAQLGDGRSRSGPESRLRWIWVVEAGLPRPLVNVPVHDPSGELLGVPDLLDERSGLVGEYDGAQHRALQAHTDDNSREERFERHNLVVTRATAIDIYRRRPQLLARLRAAYRDGLARDRSRDRWTIAA